MKDRITFGIIGRGRFGALWARCLGRLGRVVVCGRKSSPALFKKAMAADILFLAVPISQMEKCCRRISPFLGPRTIVADVCSVKEYPAKIMRRILPGTQPIVATHPLFGPDSVARLGLPGQKIVVSVLRASAKQKAFFESIFKTLKLKIIHATPEEHDRQMARSQALVHFIGRGLQSLNLQPQEISTPDYQFLLRMNDMVTHDTRQLFLDMQRYNRFAKKIRQRFLNDLKRINSKIQR